MVIFHKEAKHILVCNGILYQVFVKTVAEDFLCGMTINGVLYENRCSCKTEYLSVVEELDNVLVAVAEMAAVALVKNHHDTGMAYFLNATAVPLFADGGIEFLYGGDDNLGIAVQTLHQFVGVVGTVNGTRFKRLVFGLRLSVEVVTVNDKHHLIHIVQLGHQLCRLE